MWASSTDKVQLQLASVKPLDVKLLGEIRNSKAANNDHSINHSVGTKQPHVNLLRVSTQGSRRVQISLETLTGLTVTETIGC